MSLAACQTAPSQAPAVETRPERVQFRFEDYDESQELSLEFPRPMLAFGQGREDKLRLPVKFEPELPCLWHWDAGRILRCTLRGPELLRPASRYRVSLDEGFFDREGRPVPPFSESFETARPQLTGLEVLAWRSPTEAELRIWLNQPVQAEGLTTSLRLVSERGEVVGLRLLSGQAETREGAGQYERDAGYRLTPERPLAPGGRYELKLGAGLMPSLGNLPSLDSRKGEVLGAFPDFRFLGGHCEVQVGWQAQPQSLDRPCPPESSLVLSFSAQPDPAHLRALAKQGYFGELGDSLAELPDAEGWEADNSQDVYTLRLSGLGAGRAYALRIGAAIRDRFGRPLPGEQTLAWRSGHHAPRAGPTQALALLPLPPSHDLGLYQRNAPRLSLDLLVREAGAAESRSVHQEFSGPVDDRVHAQGLDLVGLLRGQPGLVQGRLERPGVADSSSEFLAAVTPFNVTGKRGPEGLLFWLTDMNSAQPVAGAEVSIVSADRKLATEAPQPGHSGRTDGEGRVLLPDAALRGDREGSFFLHVVAAGREAWLPLRWNGHELSWSHGDTADAPDRWIDEIPEGGLLYWGVTDKSLYRPGETLRYQLFLRQRRDNRLVIPVKRDGYSLQFLADRQWDEPFHRLDAVHFDDQGRFAGELRLPARVADGYFRIELMQGLDEYVDGQASAQIAAYEPPTYKVTVSAPQGWATPGRAVAVTARAEYLSGGPFGNALGELSAALEPVAYGEAFPRHADFAFGDNGKEWGSARFTPGLRVDAQGRLSGSIAAPDSDLMLGRLKLVAGVRDAQGEWLYSPAVSMPYAARERFVGLRGGSWLQRVGKAETLEAVVLDREGRVLPGRELRLVAERLDSTYGRQPKVLDSQELCKLSSAKTPQACQFTPKREGRYRLRAELPGDGGSLGASLERWVFGQAGVDSDEPNLSIEPLNGKERPLRVGEEARFAVGNPLGVARALITVERLGVLQSWWQDFREPVETLRLPLTARHYPGFSLSIQLLPVGLHQRLAEAGPGFLAYRSGSVRVKVAGDPGYPRFTLEADKPVYRPGEAVKLRIRGAADPDRRYLVAVMDAGLLELSQDGEERYNPDSDGFLKSIEDWRTPDSLQALAQLAKAAPELALRPRARGELMRPQPVVVESAYAAASDSDEVERIEVTGSRIRREDLGQPGNDKNRLPALAGGRGSGAFGKGRGIAIRRQFAETAYWNPDLRADARGEATVEFRLPDNLTEWRVIVLASDARGLSKQSLGLKTQLGLELREHLPAQLTDGDELEARMSLLSRRDRGAVPASLAVQGPVAGGSLRRDFRFQGVKAFTRVDFGLGLRIEGTGELAVLAEAGHGAQGDALELAVPVRGTRAEMRLGQGGVLEGEVQRLALARPADALDGPLRLRVQVATSPVASLEAVLRYQRDYPHACWEQRLSRALSFALAAARPGAALPDADRRFIDATLAALVEFQSGNGGMAFWQARDDHTDDELSAYTLAALRELRALGHVVPRRAEERLAEFVEGRLRLGLGKGKSWERERVPTAQAVAALAASAPKLVAKLGLNIPQLKARLEETPGREAQWLQAAESLPGAQAWRDELRVRLSERGRETASQVEYRTGEGFWLGSVNAERCQALRALLDSGALSRGSAAKWLRGVLAGRNRQGHFGDTQANAQCLWTLHRFEQRFPASTAPGELRLSGAGLTVAPLAVPGNGEAVTREYSLELGRDTRELVLVAEPRQALYYDLQLVYPQERRDAKPEAAGLSLERHFFRWQAGHWLPLTEGMPVAIGDWLKVELDLVNPLFRSHIALSDPVPGGLRPVSEQLVSVPGLSSGDEDYYFYERQLKAEVVQAYADFLPPGRHRVAYLAQVVAAGRFLALPARVEAMYDDAVHASTGSYRMSVPQSSTTLAGSKHP